MKCGKFPRSAVDIHYTERKGVVFLRSCLINVHKPFVPIESRDNARSVIHALSKDQSLWQGGTSVPLNDIISVALETILEAAVRSLGCSRSSVWLLREDTSRLFCIQSEYRYARDEKEFGTIDREHNQIFFDSLFATRATS